MKILLLNPQFDTLHLLAEGLRQEGAIVLEAVLPSDVLPILQMHGRTVDLAILHREGDSGRGDAGVQLIRDIRAQSEQADLPLILTSLNWGDSQFSQHQSTPSACHAYLKLPAEPSVLARLVEKVLQVSLPQERGRDEDSLRSKRSAGGAEVPPTASSTASPSPEASSAGEGIAISLDNVPELSMQGASQSSPQVRGPAGPMLEDASGLYTRSVSVSHVAPSSMTISLEAPLNLSRGPQLQSGAPAESSLEIAAPLEVGGASAVGAAGLDLTLEAPSLEGIPSLSPETLSMEGSVDLSSAAPSPVSAEAPSPEAPSPEVPDSEVPDSGSPLLISSLSDHEIRNWVQPPVGDAIVPGGASESPDLETLKRYLMLREQDVAALSVQLRTSKAQVKALNDQLEVERVRAVELTHETERQKQVLRDVELEKQAVRDSADSELEEMRLQMRARGDKMRLLELQVKDAALEMDQLRERVRSDLRRIRVREQELENRLELLKKDSGAQLAAREEKLNEARRKADVLEFNNELLQSQIAKERAVSQKLREQLAQVSRMVRMAGGMLAGEEGVEGSTASASKADDFLVSQSQKTSRAA